MVMGDVEQIITTSRPLDELFGFYPGYTVLPIEQVPIAALKRYRYWEERP